MQFTGRRAGRVEFESATVPIRAPAGKTVTSAGRHDRVADMDRAYFAISVSMTYSFCPAVPTDRDRNSRFVADLSARPGTRFSTDMPPRRDQNSSFDDPGDDALSGERTAIFGLQAVFDAAVQRDEVLARMIVLDDRAGT